MKESLSNLWDHPSEQVGLLLAVCLCLFFMNLGQWDLWNPDEPRYAQVAREMVNGGDWILMHFNGQLYTDKPPLFFWLVALSSYLWQGFSSFAVRFPSAFFGTLTVLLTFLIGGRLFSARAGLISALLLATSAEFAYLSTRANIDATLTFFTTVSIFCFLRWYEDHPPHPIPLPAGERASRLADGERSKTGGLWIYGFYAGMGLATLTKGPVGFLLPLLVCLTYLIALKDWKRLREMKFLTGLFLFFLIVGSWYVPALIKGGKEYFDATLMHHTVERFAKGSSHVRPFYYYLYNFPLDFLPWFLFLPGAIAYGFSREMSKKKAEYFFLLIWFIVIFLFFSISKGKRGLYLLPLFPAVSLMVGKLLEDFTSSSMTHFRRKWVILPLYGFMGLLLVGGIAVSGFVSMRFHSYLPYSLPITLLATGGSIGAFVLYRFKLHGAVFILLIGMMAGLFFYTTRVVFPLADPYNSARTISEEITSRVQPGQKIAIYGIADTGSFNYYTGIVPIVELKRLEHVMAFMQSEGRVYCLLWDRDLAHYQGIPGWPAVEVIGRQEVGHRNIVLVSNRKDRP
jgi:4-amino-4-deoxy-L-arabinose transferase-like glycosyltransferase